MKSLILLEKTPKDADSLTNSEVLNPQKTGDADGGHADITDYYLYGQGGSKNIQARYALKVLGFATRTYRQPLQVGIPRQSPILFDVGSYRPVLTVSGVVEREALPDSSNVTFESNLYYAPTFFQLQHAVTQWNYVQGEEILLTHLHTNVASVTYEQYNVAIQNATFGLQSQLPKLWTFEITFVSTRPVAKRPSKNV